MKKIDKNHATLLTLFILGSLIFIFSSFDFGLFFNKHVLKWGLAINTLSILAMLFALFKNKLSYFYFLPFLIPLMYMISVIGAESPMSAIQQTLHWTSFAAFFSIIYISKESIGAKRVMPYILYLLFIILSIFPYLVEWNMVDYTQAFWDERMASVFQYPNTFGVIMVVSLLFGLIQLTREDLKWYEIVYFSFPLSLFMGDLLLTFSRGSFVVLPIAWIIGLAFLKTLDQLKYIVFTLLIVVCGFFIFQGMSGGPNQTYFALVEITLSTLIFTLIVLAILTLLRKVEFNIKQKWSWVIPSTILVIGVGLIIDLLKKGIVFNLLPTKLQERVSTINFSTGSVEARFRFNEQAIEMSKEAPLFGFGGGGWRVLFTKFQEVPFWAKETHNLYLELVLNIGWIGLIVFLVTLIVLLFNVGKRYKDSLDNNQKKIIVSTFPAIAALLVHGFIDFDFSFGTVILILFWLIIIGLPEIGRESTKTKPKLIFKALVTVLVVGISFATYYSIQFYTAQNTLSNIKDKTLSLNEAEQKYLNVKNKNPWNPDYYLELAEIYKKAYENNKNENVRKRIYNLLEEAAKLEPHNPSLLYKIGQIYSSLGAREKALKQYDKAANYDRFSNEYTFAYIVQSVLFSEDLLINGQKDEGIKRLNEAISKYKKFTKFIKEYNDKDIPDKRDLSLDKRVYLLIGEAYFLKGSYNKAVETLQKVEYNPGENKQEYIRKQTINILIHRDMGQDLKAKELMVSVKDQQLLENYINYFNRLLGEKY